MESILMRDFCFSVLIHQQLRAIITIVGKLTQNEINNQQSRNNMKLTLCKTMQSYSNAANFHVKGKLFTFGAGPCRDFLKKGNLITFSSIV